MNNYRKLNNLLGWLSFAIASTVYLLTAEPTVSWWDCGEYISTAYKLQVGHPPGAPFFQMLGRFFSLFAFGDVSKVAFMINAMSALSSGFTILFLFWTITAIAKKIAAPNGEEMPIGNKWAVLGSGLVGALAYTFTDSFWFSAVEGEVYAMSSFFTALVFWSILKWEAVSEEKHANRWILFITFQIGLSIGVHLLNLLAIPAIAFVYYFKKYKVSTKGVIITALTSLFLLAAVMYIIIPWIVKIAGNFELFFVNTVGMPFNSGTIIYFLLLISGIAWGIYFTQKRKKVLANTILLCFTFILIGYSSFFMLVIRANANTPINENDPDDAISLLSYLNREQYGDWPIFYGQYYNAPIIEYKDASPVYVKDVKKGKYIITDDRKQSISVYDPKFCTIFPRMWSNQKQSHINLYKQYGKIHGIPVSTTDNNGNTQTLYKPTFGENLRFFFTYQVGHMYLRYFMWNFVGRQNEIESQGSFDEGNWKSGISILDNWRLGDQDNLPQSMQSHANNSFYFLPLILGLLGFIFHLNRNHKDTTIVALLFFMTGIAIVVYLNQYPLQPRERDYSYAGSFYAFAIWIGIGVLAIYEYVKKMMKPQLAAIFTTLVCLLLVPTIMAKEGWDDHDRSGRYATLDYAANYLNSCAPNAILITNGDNDTFPLWYAQEVEGIRRDVRVVCYMLASGDWYIHQLGRKTYESDKIPFTLSPEQYNKGINEYVAFYDVGISERVELKDMIDLIASDNPDSKLSLQDGKLLAFFPSKKVQLTVDSAAVLANGIVPKRFANKIVKTVEWDIKSNYLFKNDLMLLDFLATNLWKRPLYFSSPATTEKIFGVNNYCHLEGWVYKFMPVAAENYVEGMGGVDSEGSYDILMNKCKWGNLNNSHVYVDRESSRNSLIPRNNFMRLAQALVEEGKNDSAIKVLDRCLEVFPNNKIPFDIYMAPFSEIYYKAGAIEKGDRITEQLSKVYIDNLNYYFSLSPKFSVNYDTQKQQHLAMLHRLAMVAKENKRTVLSKKIEDYVNQKIALLN
ncbi:MAG: DUF2723 domain-containing protein [Lentimicrobiaceae bacterium]|nr:DUF2723 domain-containing protein [Lentimicrobiaceae bacterium]